MKKLTIITLLIISIAVKGFAQKTSVTVYFTNTTSKEYSFFDKSLNLFLNFLNLGSQNHKLNAKNTGTTFFDLRKPRFITLSFTDNDRKRALNYQLYLSPGDKLLIKADFKHPDFALKISGKGAENNQPAIALKHASYANKFYGDTLPDRAMNALNGLNAKALKNFNNYLKHSRPTPSFIKDWRLNQKYSVINDFFMLQGNTSSRLRRQFERNFMKWKKVQDSLFSFTPLNNNQATSSPNYLNLIANFLGRERDRLFGMNFTDPVKLYNEWYDGDIKGGKSQFNLDNDNLLREKVIHRYFTGESAAYLYAILIEHMLKTTEINNIGLIFDNYKRQFPMSPYIPLFQPHVKAVIQKLTKPINENTVFLQSNGIEIKTFAELLALNHGKTVLVDMWGTWCGPCREEIEQIGPLIKAHFKDKGLSYLYIANFDQRNQKKWKELVGYFNMEGTHILANGDLTEDIMNKVKGTGYPTYIILKKDGSYELSKTNYPTNPQILIKQIEEALKK